MEKKYLQEICYKIKEEDLERQAFTMIELIFIIVIIGILIAVAIPLLSATSNDAKGAKIAHALSVCIDEAGSRFMKKGSFEGTTLPGGNQTTSCRTADRCFDFVETDSNGSLRVISDPAATSAQCQEAQQIAEQNMMATTHVINF